MVFIAYRLLEAVGFFGLLETVVNATLDVHFFMKERAGKAARPKKTNWKHLRRRQYEVVESSRGKRRLWTDTELQAAQLLALGVRIMDAGDRKKLALLEKLGHVALANNAVKLR